MGTIADKLDYSFFSAISSPEALIALGLTIAAFCFARRAAVEQRKEDAGEYWNPIPGYILWAASFGFFIWKAVTVFAEPQVLFATLSPSLLWALARSATFLCTIGVVAVGAAWFTSPMRGLRLWAARTLAVLYLVYLAWKTGAVMPTNLEPGNVNRTIYAVTQALLVPRTFIIGVMSITAVWSLHFLATTGRRWWRAGFAFTISYIVFFSWQIYWALYTIRGKAWGTRG